MDNPLFTAPFLNKDSEMGKVMRSHNWAESVLGSPDTWPQSLLSHLNVIMSSAFPMFLFWGDDLICFYNDAFRQNLDPEESGPALGKKGRDVWHESWNFIGPSIEGVMTSGKAVWYEDKRVPFYRNGKVEDIFWTFSCSPVADDGGEICGVMVICNETTEKVNLLKKLEESSRLYSFAVEESELGTWDLDPKTFQFLANDRLKEWFGVDSSGQIELSVAIDAIVLKDRDRVMKAIEYSLRSDSGGHYDIEYTIVNTKTGEERIVKAKGRAVFDKTGEAYRFNGTLQDITKEVAARESSQKLSVLVENSVDLMAILRMDGKNGYINRAGKRLLGIDENEDVTQIPISELHTPEQLAFVQAEILPSVMTNGTWAGTFAIKNRQTGEIIPLRNNCHRIDDQRTGETIGIGAVMRDIRPEINARQKLEDEVRDRTLELSKLNEQLERKNKELTSFAFVSSHDLQEPLRKINTFISRIEESGQSLSDKNAQYFGKIKSSATRMQILIHDLLNFSRLADIQTQVATTDLNALLAETLGEYQQQIKAANGMVTSSELPALNVIPYQIRQLLDNLVGNAIKFTRTDTPLKLVISYDLANNDSKGKRTYHRISIQDNGIGFKPEYRDKIFEVFQRLHGRDAYEGTGIGLSICKRIMENHQGYINANGILGEGATFELYFPAEL